MELSLFGAIVCALILAWILFVEIPYLASEGEPFLMFLYRKYLK